jgi:hypothetical protein
MEIVRDIVSRSPCDSGVIEVTSQCAASAATRAHRPTLVHSADAAASFRTCNTNLTCILEFFNSRHCS